MRDVLLLGLVFGAIALSFSAWLLIANRRRAAQAPFTSEVRVPPEVREAVLGGGGVEALREAPMVPMAGSDTESARDADADPDERSTEAQPASDDAREASDPAEPTPPAAAPVAPLAHRPLSPGSHVPLVDALVGMRLPCDLLFLSNVEAEPGVREVLAFVTTTHERDEVTEQFVVELQRLDYEVAPGASQWEVLATRSDGTFRMVVHAPAGGVLRGKAKAFPTAPEAGVVVELSKT